MRFPLRWLAVVAAAALGVAACQDHDVPLQPTTQESMAPGQDVAALFRATSPDVMAIPGTVFGAADEETGQLVFGVEDGGVAAQVRQALQQRGVTAGAFRIVLTEPIHFMSDNLRSRHRPTVGGLQIHWSNYVCTLGFNVDHAGGRSFITNSHCTNNQGSTGNTAYYQPASSVDSSPIAHEAHDPGYFRGGVCPRGRVCRYSDAARALYQSGTESSRGVIAKTTGENNGSLSVSGSFSVASQDNGSTAFSGTIHKVGRTTGWTSGNVTNTCATVNVSGSNITQLCQTLVRRSGSVIVQGGDSGSPVFRRSSGDNVDLVGVLWGGSGSGDLFVFSPLKNIQDELGAMTATASGDAPPPDNGDDDDGGGDDEPNCPPNSNNPRCR